MVVEMATVATGEDRQGLACVSSIVVADTVQPDGLTILEFGLQSNALILPVKQNLAARRIFVG